MIFHGETPVTEIILHCSATRPKWMDGQGAKAKRDEIRRWHTEGNGWSDIGYHWVIDRDGRRAEGRKESRVGAHCRGHNRGTIGICLIGGHGGAATDDFSAHFTTEQHNATWRLIREISKRTDLQTISGHNEYAKKACPCFKVPTVFQLPPSAQPKDSLFGWLRFW